MAKQLVHAMVNSSLFSNVLNTLGKFDRPRPNHLRVLTYHRIGAPDAFAAQMSYLAQHHHVVSMQELFDVFDRGRVLPPHSVMVTFDDAYQDFASQAWPIMKRYRLPATVFVATAFPDQPDRVFWWDRLQTALTTTKVATLKTPLGQLPLNTAAQRTQAYKRLRDYVKTLPHLQAMTLVDEIYHELGKPLVINDVLGWEALRRLAKEGVTLGAHTQTHPLMNRVSATEAVAEAFASLRDLEREIGSILPIFAYPNGSFNQAVVNQLKEGGMALAFTTGAGGNDLNTVDWLRLRRNNMGPHATVAMMQSRLLLSAVYAT
ncbi:MAG: polysaccharide deacetylase family protein [Caldilineaceae bacterium]|nr:polysaccharide deacetylase family protein [Caldilineaceae bacterium]